LSNNNTITSLDLGWNDLGDNEKKTSKRCFARKSYTYISLDMNDILTANAAIIYQHQREDAEAPPGADDIRE
jgi:hypothetical protein